MEYSEFLVVLAMVLVNAVFAAYEIALASVSLSRLQMLATEKRRGAAAAVHMKSEIEQSLAVVQLGITLVGLIAGATGGASASEDIAPMIQSWGVGRQTAEVLAIALVVVPLTAITIVVGELMPKLFALKNKEWVALILSPMMRFFARSTFPIVWFLESSASGLIRILERFFLPRSFVEDGAEPNEIQEIRNIVNSARASRLIGAREEGIILGAAKLSAREVGEIAIPADQIRTLQVDEPLADSLVKAHLDMHTRFPVTEQIDEPQSIVGYVTFKDIVSSLRMNGSEPTIQGILRAIPSIPASTNIANAMEFLLRERTHISLVRDSDSTILGMITLEDIVEELVGDIQDEHDQLPVHIIKSGSGWVVGGGVNLQKMKAQTGIDLIGPEVEGPILPRNISTLIIERMAPRPPAGGENIQVGEVRVVIRKVRRQRVLEAFVMNRN